jgi:hypothetical protein
MWGRNGEKNRVSSRFSHNCNMWFIVRTEASRQFERHRATRSTAAARSLSLELNIGLHQAGVAEGVTSSAEVALIAKTELDQNRQGVIVVVMVSGTMMVAVAECRNNDAMQ